jgi:hypothetical protein
VGPKAGLDTGAEGRSFSCLQYECDTDLNVIILQSKADYSLVMLILPLAWENEHCLQSDYVITQVARATHTQGVISSNYKGRLLYSPNKRSQRSIFYNYFPQEFRFSF